MSEKEGVARIEGEGNKHNSCYINLFVLVSIYTVLLVCFAYL